MRCPCHLCNGWKERKKEKRNEGRREGRKEGERGKGEREEEGWRRVGGGGEEGEKEGRKEQGERDGGRKEGERELGKQEGTVEAGRREKGSKHSNHLKAHYNKPVTLNLDSNFYCVNHTIYKPYNIPYNYLLGWCYGIECYSSLQGEICQHLTVQTYQC